MPWFKEGGVFYHSALESVEIFVINIMQTKLSLLLKKKLAPMGANFVFQELIFIEKGGQKVKK